MTETVRRVIIDPNDPTLIANMAMSQSDPTKVGQIVTNPDGSDIAAALETLATAIENNTWYLKQVLPMLEPSNLQDSAGRQRIAIDYIAGTTLGNGAAAGTVMFPGQTIPVMNASTGYVQMIQPKIDQLWTWQNELDVAFNTGPLQNLAYN